MRQLRAHARQHLAVIGRQLGQFKLINLGFEFGGFGLQAEILRAVSGLRAYAALDFAELAASIGLLLWQLAEGISDFAGAFLLLLGLTALFQQLAADL
ncbi:hypothetical protein D3C84_1139930 [compost metagenome]